MRFFHSAVGEARDLVVFRIDSTIRSLVARREGGGQGTLVAAPPPVRSREWNTTPLSRRRPPLWSRA